MKLFRERGPINGERYSTGSPTARIVRDTNRQWSKLDFLTGAFGSPVQRSVSTSSDDEYRVGTWKVVFQERRQFSGVCDSDIL